MSKQPSYNDCANCGTCDHDGYVCPCACHRRAKSLATQLRRSIRANRRSIKRALPFQGFDPLARRKSFADAASALRREGIQDRRAQVALRYVSLLQDTAVRYLPATGAP